METHSFRGVSGLSLKLCRNCGFPQDFHNRKLGEHYGILCSILSSQCISVYGLDFYRLTPVRVYSKQIPAYFTHYVFSFMLSFDTMVTAVDVIRNK